MARWPDDPMARWLDGSMARWPDDLAGLPREGPDEGAALVENPPLAFKPLALIFICYGESGHGMGKFRERRIICVFVAAEMILVAQGARLDAREIARHKDDRPMLR